MRVSLKNLTTIKKKLVYKSKVERLNVEREHAKKLCKLFFKNDDDSPFELTDGQADIWNVIMLKRYRRNHVMTTTQYGKSETVAMAVVLRSMVFREKWTILAGDQNKSDIIMGKAISHIFDHPSLVEQIELEGLPKLEKLKHQKSQDRITWRDGGEIRSLTADARNRKRVKETLTGQGGRNIIEDEAALIPDDLQSMVMRMLGGHADSFLLKIGNPFYRNHFLRSSKNSKYNRIIIDYLQAMAEGRLQEDFIDEMRGEPFFDVLYEVVFPPDDDVVTGGYRRLFPDELIENALISEAELEGVLRLGCDFAGGGSDRSSYVLRSDMVMRLLSTNKLGDTMAQIPILEEYVENYGIANSNVAVDYGGLGQGIGDRLYEKDRFVNKVMFGGGASDRSKYKNKRAEIYFLFKQWLEDGGRIIDDEGWQELSVVYYKADSSSRFQIEPKEALKKRMKDLGLTVSSPDVADAGALTFADDEDLFDDEDFEVL